MKVEKRFEKYIRINYPIQTGLNNEILRKKSIEVKEITDKIKEFAEILHAWMIIYDWVWLAAPQIWKNIRMIAVSKLNKKEDTIISSQVLINPEIIEKSDKMVIEEEGCLSLPWMEWKVKRHYKIKVKYLDVDWKRHEMNLTWLNAGIVQHEIDHLDGILFWDKVLHKDKWINLKKFINL